MDSEHVRQILTEVLQKRLNVMVTGKLMSGKIALINEIAEQEGVTVRHYSAPLFDPYDLQMTEEGDLLLFDEVEKASTDVQIEILRVLQSGRLVWGSMLAGKTVESFLLDRFMCLVNVST